MFSSIRIQRKKQQVKFLFLAGKKATEIKEMVFVIYPTSKAIKENNCYFLPFPWPESIRWNNLQSAVKSICYRERKPLIKPLTFLPKLLIMLTTLNYRKLTSNICGLGK